MFETAETAAGTSTFVPLPASFAAFTIAERMAAVMRRQHFRGQPTTLADFLEAVETCDISEAVLNANLGSAKRLLHPEMVRHDQPAAPVQPWDHDRDYRRERVARAVAALAGAVETERRQLRFRYADAEFAALWPEIVDGLHARLSAHLPQRTPSAPDSVADWARESLLPAAGSRVETFDAYWHYRRWCHHRGDRRLQANHRAFFDRLDALGYIRRREDHHSVVLDVQLAAAFGEVS